MPYFNYSNTMNNNRLALDEFSETLLELTSSHVLDNFYIETYADFCNSLIFDFWKEYYYSEIDLSIRHFASIMEIFFINLFQHSPSSSRVTEIKL